MVNAFKFYSLDEFFKHNFIHATHTDMDGYGNSVVVSVAKSLGVIPSNTEYYTINIGHPGQFVDKVEQFTAEHPETETWPVLVTDINATNNILDYFEDTGIPFVIVDHHITSDEIKNRLKEMSPVSTIDTRASATRLMFDKIGFYSRGTDHMKAVLALDDYTSRVSQYDTGNWGNWEPESIFSTSNALREQLLFMGTPADDYVSVVTKQITIDINTIDANRDLYSLEPVKHTFGMLSIYQTWFNGNLMSVDPDCLDKGPVRINKGVAIPFNIPFISIISKKYLEEHRDVDVLVILNNKHESISLRSIDFDVQKLAAAYGGGGHPRAAGFPVENMSFTISFGRPGRRTDQELILRPAPILDEKNDKNTN